MTAYNHQLTMIVPESEFAGANALAALFGEGQANDLRTFTNGSRENNGTSYAWVQAPCKSGLAGFVDALAAGHDLPLQQPAWGDVDIAAAQTVMDSALVLNSFDADNPPAWAGQTILALNVPAEALFAAYGIIPKSDD